jgi:hypothetical protein
VTPSQDISTTEQAENRAFKLALLSQCSPGMTPSESLRDVIGRGVALNPSEAVAIAQQLIASANTERLRQLPLRPLSLENVRLGADGSIACECTVTGVAEIGMLLAEMLPAEGTVRVPGALRYTIARALSQVDAPSFDSISQLSAALARHELGDRGSVLRDLYVRAAIKPRNHEATRVDRRQRAPSVAMLRRQLREADEELFYHRSRTAASPATAHRGRAAAAAAGSFLLEAEPTYTGAADGRFNAARWALGSALALSIAFGTGYTLVARLRGAHVARPATAAVTPAPPPTAAPAEKNSEFRIKN